MKHRTVTLAELTRRDSFLPADFIYQRGQRLTISGERIVVVGQEGDDVWVSDVWVVPGSTTPFACSVPRRVSLYDIDRRNTREAREWAIGA